MNFLAHSIFADGPSDVLFGSVMGDYIAVPKNDLPIGIRDGVALHSGLDNFYDTLAHLRPIRKVLYGQMKGYQDLVMDIAADHVIASHWDMLFDVGLDDFSEQVASVLEPRQAYLTDNGINASGGIGFENWFGAYAERKGLISALERMAERAKRGHLILGNIPLVLEMLPEIEDGVLLALPSIRRHAKEHMTELGYDAEIRLRWRDEYAGGEYIRRSGERR